jgi:cytochrome P450
MATELPSASVKDNVQFNQTVIVPNAAQGLFRRRPGPVGVATRLDADRRAVRLLSGMRRRYGSGPVWVRVMANRALLVLSPEDVRRVLEGSPHPFAADPEAKRRGMGHFQPDALTLSRGDVWADRRRFTEAVLDTPDPVHRLADRFLDVVTQETAQLIEETGRAGDELDYDALHRTFRRIVRRIVLGEAARDDEEVSDLLAGLMSEANKLPVAHSGRFEPFRERIRSYVGAEEPGGLLSLFADAPSGPETREDGQVPHWLFALQDTLSANLLRTLALIASHPAQRAKVEAELSAANGALDKPTTVAGLNYLRGCINDTMRLFPTTPLLSRVTLVDLAWNGVPVPAGTQVLIVNTFFHRDPDRVLYADRFAPEEWTEGSAGQDWTFNHFSHGPQGCPGTNIALFVGSAVLAELLTKRNPVLLDPKLDPDRPLPHMLNIFGLKLRLDAT